MDNSFSKLEAVVEKLLGSLKTTRDENASLILQIKSKDDKIAELEDKIQSLNSDQNDINGRVSSLINSIEDWEKSVSENSEMAVDNMDEAPAEAGEQVEDKSSEGPLFSMGE